MSEFVVSEEAFKLGLMERVPMPAAGECFLLYQMGYGEAKSCIINSGVKYSSAEIRHGHYNRRVTISLSDKVIDHEDFIVMEDNDFRFYVFISISYALQDVQKYFFNGQMDESDIQKALRRVIREENGKWSVQDEWKIRSTIEDRIWQQLKQYEGVKFKISELIVEPDEDAVKMIQSNKDNKVKIQATKNKRDLTEKQVEDMAYMMHHFGNLGPIVADYLKDGMTGVDLYNFIMKAKTDNMTLLNTAVSNDMLTQKEAFEKLKEILNNNTLLQSELQQLPGGENGNIEQLPGGEDGNIEMKKEERETDEVDPISPVDGDYI